MRYQSETTDLSVETVSLTDCLNKLHHKKIVLESEWYQDTIQSNYVKTP